MAIYKKTSVVNRNNLVGAATAASSEFIDRTWTRFDFGIHWSGSDGGVTGLGNSTYVGLVKSDQLLSGSPAWAFGYDSEISANDLITPVWIKWEAGTRAGTVKELFYNYGRLIATRDNVDPGFGSIHIQDSDPEDAGRPGPRYTIALAGTEYRVYTPRPAGFGDKPYVTISAPLLGFPFPLSLGMKASSSVIIRNVISGAGVIPTTIYSKKQQIEDWKIAVTVDSGTDVFTATAHGLANDTAIWIDANTLPGGLTAGALYWVRDQTSNTFKVAATQGGAAVNITSNGADVVVAPRQGLLNLRIYQIGRYPGVDGLPTDVTTPSLL